MSRTYWSGAGGVLNGGSSSRLKRAWNVSGRSITMCIEYHVPRPSAYMPLRNFPSGFISSRGAGTRWWSPLSNAAPVPALACLPMAMNSKTSRRQFGGAAFMISLAISLSSSCCSMGLSVMPSGPPSRSLVLRGQMCPLWLRQLDHGQVVVGFGCLVPGVPAQRQRVLTGRQRVDPDPETAAVALFLALVRVVLDLHRVDLLQL